MAAKAYARRWNSLPMSTPSAEPVARLRGAAPGEVGGGEARPRRRDPARPRQAEWRRRARRPPSSVIPGRSGPRRRRRSRRVEGERGAFGRREGRIEFGADSPAALGDPVGPRPRLPGTAGTRPGEHHRPARRHASPPPVPTRRASPPPRPRSSSLHPCSTPARRPLTAVLKVPATPISPPSAPRSRPKPGRTPRFAKMPPWHSPRMTR